MNTDEMIAVMQAYAKGKTVEVTGKGTSNWRD